MGLMILHVVLNSNSAIYIETSGAVRRLIIMLILIN